jgi:hypothetical protein
MVGEMVCHSVEVKCSPGACLEKRIHACFDLVVHASARGLEFSFSTGTELVLHRFEVGFGLIRRSLNTYMPLV